MMVKNTIALAAFATALSAYAFTVDSNMPAGKVIVDGIDGEEVRLKKDLRDRAAGDWMYWAFRVKGAAGRTLRFRFVNGSAVGSRGAAVSTDCGRTWRWSDFEMDDPRDSETGDHASWSEFTWKFSPDAEEVWFCQTIPYTQNDWEAFVSRHAADYGRAFVTNTLCLSRKGRPVEAGRFGRIDGKAKHRMLLASRHHCAETTATFVLEGILESVFADDDLGKWMRENIEIRVVPFMDKDGVVDGDMGKNRMPHDHCRDYNDDKPSIYPEVAAIRAMVEEWTKENGALSVVMDVHCPWLRGSWFVKDCSNEYIYTVGIKEVDAVQRRFCEVLERVQRGGLGFMASDHYAFGRGWNTAKNYTQGSTLTQWAIRTMPNCRLAVAFEIPFANHRRMTLTPPKFRAFGGDIAAALREFLDGAASAGPECIDGVYPHLAMFNDEDECGTGAVVPWAGDLWVVTYGPHCPLGSTDKLYRIKPDLTRETFAGSVGGTPANRMIHRETNQLLIGPYVIDAKGNVRVMPPMKMPGRLTANARHLTDPAHKAYYATMEAALFEVDLETLEVNTLIQDDGINKGYFDRAFNARNAPAGWYTAPVPKLPGYHGKGMMNGFGKLFYANNGEHSAEAKTNPFIPAGALGWWDKPGDNWHLVRRCQFTEVTSPDGIYGNEHPETNPVWTLGWDAKSVILGVTTNGAEWAYYRLPKASHAYDGAHGWNTEWPRIRDVGFGDGTFLATMHGTFWKFPKGFSPANPDGIRPISTYLKVIGDFCRWGDRIVFGCDDQAKSEFLGKRGLKKDAPRCERSQSNLWFVKPEELKSFGPPSGEGYVWLKEDVKAGDVSDPYLHAGYETMEFSFTSADGTPVRHELLEDGDWVRVKCLEDARGVTARFAYGPARCEIPQLDGKKPYVDVTDDDGRTWRFPNVNGDTNVVCREIATERDLLYVGGVWYEVPAENAGGFASLRPIALADAPVESLRGERGLMYLNGSPMAIDTLWKNGTAPAAYWLWRTHGFAH